MIARTFAGWTAVIAGALFVLGIAVASFVPAVAFGDGVTPFGGQGSACSGGFGPGSGGFGMMGGTGITGMMGPGQIAGGMMGFAPAGCGGSGSSATAPITGAADVRVQATNFAFTPTEIRLPKGDAVNLTLENPAASGVVHDLVVPALGIRVVANAGATRTVGLRGLAAGRYPAYCSVPGHADLGMRATVIVE